MSTPKGPEDVQHLAAEVGRLFGLYHEQVDRLLTERTQENERLRAELGRLDALQAETRASTKTMTGCEPSEISCWPPSAAWRTWWNKYGNRAAGARRGKRWGVDVELRGFVGRRRFCRDCSES